MNMPASFLFALAVGILVAMVAYAAGAGSHLASLAYGAGVALFVWGGLWWFGGQASPESAPGGPRPR
ncbi:MAG TPA: hypothetical protein VIL46_17685 [Gemmataceae bacterium]